MIPKECRPANRSKYLKSILFTTFLTFFLFTVFLVFPYPNGHCAQVTLTWDPNIESDLAGYEIYYGSASGNYQWKIDVGNVTTYSQSGLDTGVTYYLAATAYNTQGLESGFSNEVVYTPPSCTYTISPSSASFSVSGGSGSVLVTTQAGCNWGTSAAPSWVTVNNGSGTGTGTMSYTVSSNTGATRIASLTIAGNVFTITESGQTAYTITASAGTGGTISPSSASVTSGGSQIFTIAANSGYSISNVTVDGVSQGAISSYTFSNVTVAHTIAATFVAKTYTITASAGTGGTISPTSAAVTSGGSQTFTIAANSGYSISNVTVDGVSQGAVSSYTFSNVTAAHSIAATFVANTYTITASAGTGGTISPSSASVTSGGSQTFTIAANSGYSISNVAVDGVSQGAITSYTFSAVNANHTIAASFTPVTYTLSIAKNGTGSGTVSSNPTGTSFSAGTPVTLTASPDANSLFSGWSGSCSGTTATCQVTMNSNVSVTATFNLKTYTITASSGSGGVISPSGAVSVQSGSNQAFAITPNSGYVISSVLVDGVSQGPIASYSFTAVSANHTISTTFAATTSYTLSISNAGTGSGSVSSNPTGTSFSAGTSVTLTATPNANSLFSGWSGACSGTATTCQVTMNSNVSVTATFNLKTYTITASSGSGGVISPSGAISFQSGSNQAFAITPNSGYVISGVLVDGVSQGAITAYSFSGVNANHTISATFAATTYYTLSVTNTGTGSGSVSVNPVGTSFVAGTQVTLIATPNANSMFSGWSGACSGTTATCQVTMNSNLSVTATFSFNAATTPPTVVTGSATLVPWSSATLKGTVNPNGLSTTYVFQWGRSTSYGNTTAVTSAGSGTINTAASAGITRLSSYTIYHYRLVATNSAGTTYGSDMSFKTKFTGLRK